ncbi:MAG: sterol desaturase family protein [Alphaproteobacteria bacterium]
MDRAELLRLVLPVAAFALVGLEWAIARALGNRVHDPGETAASLTIAVGHRLVAAATAGFAAIPLGWAWELRVFDIPLDGPAAWIALFLAVELAYYWHHRAMHGVRWLWATHAVHHSATRMNLAAALRLGWFGPVTGGVVFYLPLVLLGFHPGAVLGMLALGLFYQLFLHSAWAPRLGLLEGVLNTPRHHHVHHASNAACLDRNFGGVLILWDRLFGTYAAMPEGEALRFGLHGSGGPSRNPAAILLAEWGRLLRDFASARGLRPRLTVLFGRP